MQPNAFLTDMVLNHCRRCPALQWSKEMKFSQCVLVHLPSYKRIFNQANLKMIEIYFLTLLEAGKSMIKVSIDSVFSEAPFLIDTLVLQPYMMGGRKERARETEANL
jgi:hypothetical protein